MSLFKFSPLNKAAQIIFRQFLDTIKIKYIVIEEIGIRCPALESNRVKDDRAFTALHVTKDQIGINSALKLAVYIKNSVQPKRFIKLDIFYITLLDRCHNQP